MSEVWKPSVTVAAIVERQGRFLMVEEQSGGAIRINQPAGHLEPGESLLDAVVREALEESARVFAPTALVGAYLSRNVSSSRGGMSVTYLRFAFAGSVGEPLDRALDEGILRTVWLTRDELAACAERHRSPLVLRCVDDYLRGQRAPLELLHADPSAIGSLADHGH
ncbi:MULTISPECIES: NUDIX hydrolase [unclassified Herbaspirillum]|uniref:NUDIX hydrolase n=1 Tax=unclassified Herbaspirillum TaxID=2624150 RepID=UPI0011532978|nr:MULTISPECIES: NUDIX hydrolase [unclassified Herbaspirillum]MBB5392343.1 8-oxo-dGTP pyrophosphatase MutT (NUDIX family) [Herbaspirillum sp. SJZ102]TQK05984.1 ADP-ribose pyrophosphatase YjhB (NUDIX family) [Herbaspirillum sp. SJZ130]TQK12538.1 ADP-ribose pyrophosphatase YjhB (NUDIX family) [Herbaspirillum sp. SJZ106]TWC68204.1 ADP-ribose pyrophosphatase YjhB (NUDIX family) [Herbaspirillum sp. SJZ099]